VTVEKPLAIEFGSKADVGLDLVAAGEFAGATPVSGEELDHGGIGLGLLGAAAQCAGGQENEYDGFH
jgi:hypothetical protein